MDILDQGYRKARKNHYCDGWQWIEDCYLEDFPEKPCQGISKGDEYYFQVNTYDGLQTFKACKQCMDYSVEYDVPMNEGDW